MNFLGGTNMRLQYLRTATVFGLAVVAALAGTNLADAKAKPKHKHSHKTSAPVSMMVRGPSMLVLKRQDGVEGGQINVTGARATSADGSVHFSYSYQSNAYRFPAFVSLKIMGSGGSAIGETTLEIPNECMTNPEPQPQANVKISRPISQIVAYTLTQTHAGANGSGCQVGARH
jgi:hypothetical protein